jgi:hypothetical protein
MIRCEDDCAIAAIGGPARRGPCRERRIQDIPAASVKVDDGWVTLTGNVSYPVESNAAYEDLAGLYGVVGVTTRSGSAIRYLSGASRALRQG